jgi:dihydropteroate synthase
MLKSPLFQSHRTLIMGVLNVTPDSFSDGGRFFDASRAVEHALRMADEGADIIDVGGESTRPGADPLSEEEELRRVLPVVESLAGRLDRPISIDTRKPAVAERCLRAGACIVNDVGGLRDKALLKVVVARNAAAVIMHMRGVPKTMQKDLVYDDVVAEVRSFLQVRAEAARAAGVREIAVDPGIGFGKSAEQNFEILRRLGELRSIGCPILIGPSRKSFLGGFPGMRGIGRRREGTLAAVCASVLNGAGIVRVHDVQPCKRAVQVIDAIRDSSWTRS